MGFRRGLAPSLVVVVGLMLGVGATDAPSATSIRPALGAPDPRQMVLTSADLLGATVTAQRYYRDRDFPSVISYERELEEGRFGSTVLPYVYNEAEVGTSATTTTRYLATLKRLFATKEFRAFLSESFTGEFPLGGIASNLQIGRPRSLGAGPGSFDVLMSVKILGLRTDIHIAAFRVERVLGAITVVGELGRRLPLSTVTRLAKVMAGRMTVELAPRNTGLPTIAGLAAVGQSLSATTGTWTGSPTSFAYQWERCDVAGSNCAGIAGATGQTYAVSSSEVAFRLRVGVTARNAVGAKTAFSVATSVVRGGPAPVNTSLPTITGSASVGQTLTAETGTWAGDPISFAFQWQRCNQVGQNCGDVLGATAQTYVVGTGDVFSTIRVVVTATNAAGSTPAVSVHTASVPP